jgi:hypothetical protein
MQVNASNSPRLRPETATGIECSRQRRGGRSVCDKLPDHERVLRAIESAATTAVQPLVFRAPEASRRLGRLASEPT